MVNGYFFYWNNVINIFTNRNFKGWGRKRTGRFALYCHTIFGGKLKLLEDGFIRSLGLGVNGVPSFSTVEDNIGIYYDATKPSELENILNSYDFSKNAELMKTAKEAMGLIRNQNISKYNNAPEVDKFFCIKYRMMGKEKKILIIAQTAGDTSLEYGLTSEFGTKEMIEDALKENPDASVYIKMHPDVLSGKKGSDIGRDDIPARCIVIDEDINSISLLKHFNKVYTKTSGMGMEALILGKEVFCYGMPYYAGWGLTVDRQSCERRIRKVTLEELFAGAYILYTHYYNFYSQKKSDIIDVIRTIIKYRDLTRENNGYLYFFGFSYWKRRHIAPFFSSLNKNYIFFCSTLKEVKYKELSEKGKIVIWGKKLFPEVESYAKKENIPLIRVEDGFVRSVSLGSDLTKAYSLVVDSRGIYFDPTEESDLEHMLNTYVFNDELLRRARKLQCNLIEKRISKYNNYKDKKIKLPQLKTGQKIIMVPGQVEDDASIVYGANGMTNLELLHKVKENLPDAYIIYKPHPDVLAGNRKGHIPDDVAMQYCDTIITEFSLDSVLEFSDEVHTMTSLVGFEALIRNKKVYTYGLPFYAGWGLTIDMQVSERRTVKRTLDELVSATLIHYPRYIHPKTNELCEIEVLIREIEREKNLYTDNFLYKIYIDSRNIISRKIQYVLKVLFAR